MSIQRCFCGVKYAHLIEYTSAQLLNSLFFPHLFFLTVQHSPPYEISNCSEGKDFP